MLIDPHSKILLQGLLYSLETASLCDVEIHPGEGTSYYRTKGKVDGRYLFYNTRTVDPQVAEIIKEITIGDDAANALGQEFGAWFADEDSIDKEIKQAEARLVKLRHVEKNLQRLVMEEGISLGDFKEHRSDIEAERAKLNDLIELVSAKRSLVRAESEIALNLAKQLDFLFDRGTFAERRTLCEVVFKRLYIKDSKIARNPELNSPFVLITSAGGSSESARLGEPRRIRMANAGSAQDVGAALSPAHRQRSKNGKWATDAKIVSLRVEIRSQQDQKERIDGILEWLRGDNGKD